MEGARGLRLLRRAARDRRRRADRDDADPAKSGGSLLTMTGAAPEVGALLMPTGTRWRIGATARAPVSGNTGVNVLGESILGGTDNTTACSPASGARCVGGFYVPSRVVMPWEVEAGFALQLGPRPLNPGWRTRVTRRPACGPSSRATARSAVGETSRSSRDYPPASVRPAGRSWRRRRGRCARSRTTTWPRRATA